VTGATAGFVILTSSPPGDFSYADDAQARHRSS
jgi:hypothetical protein